MKVVTPKSDTTKPKNKVILPLLEDNDEYKLDKTNSVTFDLRTIPADNDSPKYKYMV